MGTNYYWYEKQPCECCGRPYEPLHIGKSSAGWTFALHLIPDKFINNLSDWKALWEFKGSYIEDEYGMKVPIKEMLRIISDRKHPPSSVREARWYESNHAILGPKGLARSKIDGIHCIGHGEGTWDYIAGEFS